MSTIWRFIGVACLLLSVNSEILNTASAAPLSAMDYLPGFPKTEPGTIDFAGPLVADINADGRLDVLVADSGGCVWGWNAQGRALPGFPLAPSGGCGSRNRINSFAVGDVDGDGKLEIIAGTAGTGETSGRRGKVYVWNHDGQLVSGWPKEMAWNSAHANGQPEVYTVAAANVIGSSNLEVIAGTSNNGSSGGAIDEPTQNLYVWRGNASPLSGFPTWYRRAGIYGMVGAADLNDDGCAEVIPPRDHRWLAAYNSSGRFVSGWPIETFVDRAQTRNAPYVEFTRNAPSFADVDNDGRLETVIAGRVKQPEGSTGGQTVITNNAVMVFEPNGGRSPGWTVAKLGDRAPLSNSYGPSQAPALADLNSDGRLEIIVTLMDGTARAYKSDGTQMWKYNFANGAKLFASEPVIGDVNGDGRLDVVFGTYSPDGSANSRVGLLALNRNGQMLSGYPLSLTNENGEKKGIRAAPALTDLNRDGLLDIVAGSWSGNLYVWNTTVRYSAARMPWPTGRGNNARTGLYKGSNALGFETENIGMDAPLPESSVVEAADINLEQLLASAASSAFLPLMIKGTEQRTPTSSDSCT